MKIAVAKYPIGKPADFAAFAAGQTALVGEAAAAGARVLVLPEYLSLELGATFGTQISAGLPESLAAIQALRPQWMALFAGLARQHAVHLIAGSFLLEVGSGRYRNRSDWFTPDGTHGWQDKLQLTGFEKATGVIDPGDALKVFELDGVRAAIAICYDSEFPLPVRAQYEAGARLLIVPSCTDTAAGAMRVRVGCLARALENRVFVAQSVTAGEAPWSRRWTSIPARLRCSRRWMWAFRPMACWRRPRARRCGRMRSWILTRSRAAVRRPRWPMTAIGPVNWLLT